MKTTSWWMMGVVMKTGRMVLVSLRKFGVLLFTLIISGVILTGCGVEVARAPIQAVGHYQLNFEHYRSHIDLWTDLDVEYIETTNIWYEVEFSQGGEKISDVVCDPFEHEYRLMARKTEVRGVTKESYLAPMSCKIDPLPEGEIRVDIDLFAEGGRVRIFRADLVINERE